MKKVLWKTLQLSLVVGQSIGEKDITLEKGERIVCAAISNRTPDELVQLGLYENGNKISDPMNLKFWERSNAGQYLDGFKPIEFKGGSQLTARLTSNVALTGATDLQVEVVFGIIQDDTTC